MEGTYADTAVKEKRRLSTEVRFWAPTLAAAVLGMLLIFAIHRSSPRTLISFHGFLHAAVADQFLGPAPVTFPPENPFYAGEPIVYYWFFQLLGARLAQIFNWNVFWGMEALILMGMAILVISGAALGRALYRSVAAGLLIAYLVVAGTNPFGFLIAGFKIARSRGAALVDDPNHLWGVAHPLYSLIRYNDIGGLYGPLINFFLNLTSRPVALALVLAMALCLYWGIRRRSLLAFVLLAVATFFASALSVIIGVPAAGALVAGLAGSGLVEKRLQRPAAAKGHHRSDEPLKIDLPMVLFAAGAVGIGIAAAAPTYIFLIVGPGSNNIYFNLFSLAGAKHLLTMALTLLPLLLLAGFGIVRAGKQSRPYLVALFLAAMVLLPFDAVLSIPPGNEANFYHAAVVFLAVPAAAAVLNPGPGRDHQKVNSRRLALVALFFLPTTALLVASYLGRPPVALASQGTDLKRTADGSGLGELYEWAQAETSPEAVFVLDPRQRVTMTGNTAEFPALSRRKLFTEHIKHYLVGGYPDARQRVQTAIRLVSGEKLDSAMQASLAGLDRPIYIVANLEIGNDNIEGLQALYGPPVFAEGSIFVFRWQE